MDEVANDLFAVREDWGAHVNTKAKAKADRRRAERAAGKKSVYWTGRRAQINFRVTPEVFDQTHAEAQRVEKSLAEFYEFLFTAYMEGVHGAQ